MLLLVATFFMAFVLLLYMLSPLISPKPLALPGAHVVVSGPWLRRHLPGPPGCPEPAPWRAGRRPTPGRRPPFLQTEGHLRRSMPALSLRRVWGPALPCIWLLPGPESGAAAGHSACELGAGAPGARLPRVNPRGIPGMWLFLSSVFPMSQPSSREAEKLCGGHRGG